MYSSNAPTNTGSGAKPPPLSSPAPSQGLQQATSPINPRRFSDLLDQLRHEYEAVISAATLPAGPDSVYMSELSLMQKTVRELEVHFMRAKSGYEEELRRLLSILQSHNIDPSGAITGISTTQTAASPPPALDGELSAGILSSFSNEKRPHSGPMPEPAHKRPAVSAVVGVGAPSAGQTQSQNIQQLTSGWMTLYATPEKRLAVDLLHTLQTDHVVCAANFSPDGRFIALGLNRLVVVFEVASGKHITTLSDSTEREGDLYMRSVAWSPDGQLLASGAEDHFVRVWIIDSGKLKHRLAGHSSDVYSVAFMSHGRSLVSASGDRTIRLWDVPSGSCRAILTVSDSPAREGGMTSVAVSSELVVAGSLDRTIRVWSVKELDNTVESRFLCCLEGHTDAVYSVAFAKDLIISASLDKTLRVWMPTGNRYSLMDTLTHHKDFCLSVSVSPNARWIASSSKDRTVQVYELGEDCKCTLHLTLQGHRNSVISSAFSPVLHEGSMLFATGSGDNRARIWKIDVV